jgi:hypothetical protein
MLIRNGLLVMAGIPDDPFRCPACRVAAQPFDTSATTSRSLSSQPRNLFRRSPKRPIRLLPLVPHHPHIVSKVLRQTLLIGNHALDRVRTLQLHQPAHNLAPVPTHGSMMAQADCLALDGILGHFTPAFWPRLTASIEANRPGPVVLIYPDSTHARSIHDRLRCNRSPSRSAASTRTSGTRNDT